MATVQLIGDYYSMTVNVGDIRDEEKAFEAACDTVKDYYGWNVYPTVTDYEVF